MKHNISRVKLSNLLSEKREGRSVREFIRQHQQFGIAPHAWRAWESAETKPNSDNLIKLANLFELSLEAFIDLIEEKEGEQVEFKNPIRTYVRKENNSNKQNHRQETIPIQLLSEEEKASVAVRLMEDCKDKTSLIKVVLNENDALLSEILKEKNKNKLSFFKTLIETFNLKKEEKITLASFLLSEATGAEQV